MRIVESKIIPFPGYLAINIFGVVFTRDLIKFMSKKSNFNHEYTHTLQYKELWYVGFLPVYCYYYLKNRIFRGMSHDNAYRRNPLEMEAYETEKVDWYNSKRGRFAWKRYTKLIY